MRIGEAMVEKLIELLKKYGIVFLAVAIIITPIVWQVAASHYNERIESLKEQIASTKQQVTSTKEQVALVKEQIALIKEQKFALEEKLRQPSPLPTQVEQPEKPKPLDSPIKGSSSAKETIRLPYIADSESPTKDEVRALARFYGLLNRWKVNPHLRFKEGDISYWSEQGFTEQELMLEFETRQTVLRRAEISGERIPSQGDLSHKAEQLQAISRRH